MSHPNDMLYDYVAGDLTPGQAREVERHLESCPSCRVEIERMGAALVAMVEGLAPASPPAGAWNAIEDRIRRSAAAPSGTAPDDARPPVITAPPPRSARPSPWQGFAIAASLVLAAIGISWGVVQQRTVVELRQQQQALIEDQAQLARWLTRDDVRAASISADSAPTIGSVLFRSDGRALIVLDESAPPASSFQVWGQLADSSVESLGVVEGRTHEVETQGYAGIAISLEPEGGSEAPTQVVGGVPVL